jgi:hypothetical protein
VVLSTTPIDGAWKDAVNARHRFDYNTWYLSYSALSIFFDIVILCFPIPVIKTLRVDRKRKLSIIGIFWLGGFVCVSALVRFVLLYQSIYQVTDFGKNQFSAYTKAFIWAEIEPNTSVIAACLPTYGPLFRDGGPGARLFGSLRTMLGRMRGSRHEAGSSKSGSTTAVGYYNLEKVTADSKKSGDMLKEGIRAEPVSFGTELDQGGSKKSVDEEALNAPERY